MANPISFEEIDEAMNDPAPTDARAYAAIRQAEGINGDQYAEAMRAEPVTGLPADVNYRTPKQPINDDEIQMMFNETPEAKPWIEKYAKVANGDFSVVGRMKKNLVDARESVIDDVDRNRLAELRAAQMDGVVQPWELAEADTLSSRLAATPERGTGGLISQGIQGAAGNIYTMGKMATAGAIGYGTGFATGWGVPTLTGAAIGGGIGAAAGGVGAIPGAGAGAVALQPAAVQAGHLLGRAASTTAVLDQSFQLQRGLMYDSMLQVRDEDGKTLDPSIAKGATLLASVPMAALDAFGFDKLLSTVPGLGAIKGKLTREGIVQAIKVPGVKEALFRIGKDWGTAAVAEGATEGAQQAIQILGEEVAKAQSDGKFEQRSVGDWMGEVGEAAKLGALTSGTLATVPTIANLAMVKRNSRMTADGAAAYVDRINDAARTDPLAARSPEAYHALAQAIAPDEHFYIDGETALNTIGKLEADARDILFNAVPTLRSEMEIAAATGADVKISKADYAAYIAPNEVSNELRDFIKLDPLDQSVGERAAMQQFMSQNPDAAKMIQEQTQTLPLDATAEEMMPAIERIVRKSITDSGRGSVEARAVAPFFARSLARFAAPFGQNAVENLNSQLLQFQTIDKDGNPIKVGSNLNVMLDDLARVQAGERVAGLDDIGRAAIDKFAGRLQNAGITVEQARTMEPSALLDVIYPKQPTVQVGDTSISLPQVEVGLDENGGLNIGIKAATDTTQEDTERQYLEQAGPQPQPVDDTNVVEITPIEGLPEGVPLKTESPEFKEWFGDSKVADEDGKPLVVYHGTTADFSAFDRDRTDPESDLGGGFYFTNNREEVAENYAGFGPDLTNKIQRAAEQIADETDRDYSDPEVIAEARARFGESEGATMPAYLSMKNPVEIGGPNETIFDFREEYNEETDEYDEPEGSLVALMEAAREASYEFSEVDGDAVSAAMLDEHFDGDEITASNLIENMKRAETVAYAGNDEGNLIGNEYIRRVFEIAGYDGYIDHTVNRKFGSERERGKQMAAMNEETVHYIAFKPEQIKSIFNKGTFSSESANILEQTERGNIVFRGATPEQRMRNVVISFTEQANFSTAAHEFSHFAVATHRYFAALAREQIAMGNANPEIQRIAEDWETLRESVGATGDKFTVDQEEQIADMFEVYLRTGNAPSEKLSRIFTRFRDWLTKIYKDIRMLGGDPSKKVTEVFDRWLASETEIAKVQEKNSSIAQIAQALGLPDDILGRIADYVTSATTNAEESLYRKLSAEERKRQTKAYKEQFAKVREGVVVDLSEVKEYNLMDYLKANGLKILEGPETQGVDPSILTDVDGEHTVHPDEVADLYGYASGIAMLRALKATPDFDRAADRETRTRLADKYPDMIRSGRIVNEAVDAIYNDRTLLALDLMIKEMGGQSGMKQFARAMAQQQIEKMKLADSNYGFRYELAREKALRGALEASRAGKPQEALIGLQRAMVNQIMFKQLQEFRNTRDKAERLFKKVGGKDKDLAGTKDIDFIGAARFLLSKYGLYPAENFDPNAWIADIQERNPDVMNDLIAFTQMISAPVKSSKELTISEFRDIYNAVENIFNTARQMRVFEKDGKKFRADGIVADLLTTMGDVKGDLHEGTSIVGMGRIRNALSSAKAAMRRVELWAKAMDGDDNGPFSKFIFDTVKQAENKYHDERNKWMAGYLDIVKEYKDDLNKTGKIPTNMMKRDALGRATPMVWKNRMEMIGFLLHTGNESNLDKLLGGYGIEPGEFTAEMARLYRDGTITDRHWELVQKLWDYVAALKPISQAAHKKLYGYRFDEIESKPFIVGDKTLRGGYWPAVADSEQASNNKTVDQQLNDTRQYMLATVGKGFTKGRVTGYRQPLKTDLRLGSQHIDKVLRFANLEPAIRDVSRLINRQEFKDKLKAQDYDAFDGMLMPWLGRVAAQTTATPITAGDRSAAMGRRTLAFIQSAAIAQIMYYNVVVPIQNFANMSVAARLTSGRSLASAWASTTLNPLDNLREMKNASPYMAGRLSTSAVRVSQQLDHIADQKGLYTQSKDFLTRNGFIFMHAVDSYLATITWQAAYADQLAKTSEDADAIRHADSVVRQVMGAGAPSDVSKIEASHPLMKAILPFYGYFNSQMNLISTEFGNIMREHGWAGSPKMFFAYLSLIAAPAIIGDVIAKGLRGGLPGEDDEDDDEGAVLDDWMAFATESQVRYLAAGVPLLSPVANTLLSITGISSAPQMSREISPALSGGVTLKRTAEKLKKMWDGDEVNDARLLRDMMTSLGLVTGVPLGQVAKPLSYAVDVGEGNTNPEDGVDILRGVLTGPPRK